MKPLLVLVLVLAAIGALLFAVMNVGGGKKQAEQTQVSQTNTPSETSRPPEVLAPSDKVGGRTEQGPGPTKPGLGTAGAITFENKVTGFVKNANGEPVSGAEVMLTTEPTFMNDERPDPATEPRTRTNEEGRYAFLGVRPGTTYVLVVTHPQYARKRETSMPVAESGPVENPPIILTAGGGLSGYVVDESGNRLTDATLYLDGENYLSINGSVPPDRLETKTNAEGWYSFINVPAGPRTVGVTAPGYGKIQVGGFAFQKDEQYTRDFTLKLAEMISGRVVGAGNEPVVDANVIAVAVSHTQQSGMVTVKTDAKGEFLFESLVPGDYNMIANAKGWRMVQGRNNTNRVKTGSSNIVIEMLKEGTISGVVIDGASGAIVKDFGVRLRFWYGVDNPTSAASADFLPVSNDKGEFTIETPGPADFVVEATAPGYAPSYSANVTIQPGKSVNNVVVKLGRGGSIQGRVVDGDGKPIARARVQTQDNTWTDDEFTKVLQFQFPTNASTVEVRTDDAGRFTLTGLNPELYQLVITATGFTPLYRNNFRVTEGGVTQANDLKMMRGGTVRGTLFDAAGKPLANGTIRVRAIDGQYVNMATKTSADGKFTLPNVPAGRFTLSGIRAGGVTGNPFEEMMDTTGSQMNIIVAEGDTTTQDLRLQE